MSALFYCTENKTKKRLRINVSSQRFTKKNYRYIIHVKISYLLNTEIKVVRELRECV